MKNIHWQVRNALGLAPRKQERQHPLEVQLGLGGGSVSEYKRALCDAGYIIRSREEAVLELIPLRAEPVAGRLVPVLVKKLGFVAPASYEAICRKGVEIGHQLCAGECSLALALRPKEAKCPEHGEFRLAMPPIVDPDNDLRIFGVAHDQGMGWLEGYDGRPHRLWPPHTIFLFWECLGDQ